MPDPFQAREKFWRPFAEEKLKMIASEDHECLLVPADNAKTIVIGHSSGSVCAMRLMETFKVDGCCLMSPCVSDLGEANETISCYYSQQLGTDKLRPWEWAKLKKNCEKWLVQGSSDDPFIPAAEFRTVGEGLGATLYCEYSAELVESGCGIRQFEERGHFISMDLDEEVYKPIETLVFGTA